MNKKIIFLVGLHRSGTSFLHNIFRNQLNISGMKKVQKLHLNEGQHLQTLLPTASVLGGAGAFGFNKKSHMTEKSEYLNTIKGMDLFNQWKSHWQNINSNVFVEKSPPNILRTRFLQKLFPNSYFILIMRHPIINALATKKFNRDKFNSNIDNLVLHWFKVHEIVLNDIKHIKNVKIITYEELIQNPNKILNLLECFVNVEFDNKNVNIVDGNRKYFSLIDDSYIKYENMCNTYGYSTIDLNKYKTS